MGPLPPNILKCMDKEERLPLGKSGLTPEEIELKLDRNYERKLQNDIAGKVLPLHGVKWHYQARMDKRPTATRTTPDFLFCYHGRPVAWECKRPGKSPGTEQIRAINDMLRDGWNVRIIFTVAEAVQHLKEVEHGSTTRTTISEA